MNTKDLQDNKYYYITNRSGEKGIGLWDGVQECFLVVGTDMQYLLHTPGGVLSPGPLSVTVLGEVPEHNEV